MYYLPLEHQENNNKCKKKLVTLLIFFHMSLNPWLRDVNQRDLGSFKDGYKAI